MASQATSGNEPHRHDKRKRSLEFAFQLPEGLQDWMESDGNVKSSVDTVALFKSLQDHVAGAIRSRKIQRQQQVEESRRIALSNPLALELPPNDDSRLSSHLEKGMCEKLGASGQATLEEIHHMTSCLVLDAERPSLDVFCRINSGMSRSMSSHADVHDFAILG